MKFRHRAGVCALALTAGMAALQIEPTVIRNLSFETSSGRVTVGAVRAPVWSAAIGQAADSFSLENISVTQGSVRFELQRIDLTGVTSSRSDVEALFAAGSSEPLAARLAKIGAARIAIPEAKVTVTLPGETQTTTYRNTVLSDIAAGRIRSATFDSASAEITDKGMTLLARTGKGSANDLDMGALAGLYETKAKSASEPMTRIYGAFSIENIDVTDRQNTFGFKMERASGRDFLARPTPDSWSGAESVLSELDGKDNLSPEETKRLFAILADMLDAFQIGQAEATGIEIRSPAQDGGNAASAPIGRIQRMAYTGGSGQQPPDMRMEGFEVAHDDAKVAVKLVSLTGFSLAPTLEGLKNLKTQTLENLEPASLRALIPTLGTLRLSGIDIDAASEPEDGQRPERTKVRIEDYILTADKPLNGIPTNVRIEQRNAVMDVPPDSTDDLAKSLAALGYKTLTSSFVIAANWDEAASEIRLSEVSAQSPDMGSISLTGLIGNAGKDLFSSDEATLAAAALNLKAKSAQIVVEDKGLLNRYLTMAAKEQKTKPDALRKLYAGAAPLVLSSMIGGSEQTSKLADAIAAFITKPGKLTIDASPKNPSGFGFMDVALAAKPVDALKKLNISAKAE